MGTSDISTSTNVSPVNSPAVPADDNGDETDDDICILEDASTPKPQKPNFDLTKVKTENEQNDTGMLLECSSDAALDVASRTNDAEMGSAVSASVGTSPSPAPPAVFTSTTTQTYTPKLIKEEELSQTLGEGAGQSSGEQISDAATNVCYDQREIKQESGGDTDSDIHGKQTLQEGVTDHLISENDAGPSFAYSSVENRSSPHSPSILQVQEQQDQLIELMQATAEERDTYKQQIHALNCQLKEMQSQLQELQVSAQKEFSSQASQTDEIEEEKDYKSLFEKARQKVDELIKDKEALLAAIETKPSAVKVEDVDEMALEVDRLFRELEDRTKERDELRSQVGVPAVF